MTEVRDAEGFLIKTERTCANCACAHILKHPTLLNQSQMVCRRDPPMMVGQQVRTEAGMAMQHGLMHPPTSPELVCFDGWRPKWVAPGTPPDTWMKILIDGLSANAMDANGGEVKKT